MSTPAVTSHPLTMTPTAATAAAPAASTFLDKIRQRGHDIPANFFTADEEKLLKSIFKTYHLSNRLCLIDLLGFDFFQHLRGLIEEIKVIRPNDKEIDDLEISDNFCGHFLGLYLRVIRDSQAHNLHPTTATTANRYSMPLAKGEECIQFAVKCANLLLLAAKDKGLKECAGSPAPDLKRKFVLEHYRRGLEHFLHLNRLSDLWSKILHSPYRQLLLIDYNLACFDESELLETPTAEAANGQIKLSEMPAAIHIQQYLLFLEKCLTGLTKIGLAGIEILYFEKQRQLLESHAKKPLSPQLVTKWNENLHQILEPLLGLTKDVNRSLGQAIQGTLTHKQWLQKQGLTSSKPKSQDEFIETLQMTTLLSQLMSACLEDIDRMAESQLFIPHYSGYRTKTDMINYFFNALNGLVHLPKRKVLVKEDDCSQLIASFHEQLDTACRPLRDYLAQPLLAKYLEPDTGFTYSKLLALLPNLAEGCRLANTLLQALPQIQKKLLPQVEAFLSRAEPSQKESYKRRLTQACLEEFKTISSLILYFKDVEILLRKKDFLSEWDYDIPAELKQFVSLKELTALFEKEEVKPVPIVEDDLPPPPLTMTVAEVTLAAAAPRDLAEELKNATKRRDYHSILKEWDFTHVRTKGGHEMWKGPNGSQVVLPFHNGSSSLPAGTQHAVIKQAVAAIDA